MKMPLPSRLIFLVLSILMPVGAHKADFNVTHIFNPSWPPHAKFHTGQTLSFSIVLGLLTIFFAFRKTQDKTLTILASSGFSAIYWITQASAIAYPGTWFWDADMYSPSAVTLGIPAQIIIDLFFLGVTALAAGLAFYQGDRWTDQAKKQDRIFVSDRPTSHFIKNY